MIKQKIDILEYLVKKYKINLNQPLPIEIPNTSRDILPIWYKDLGFKTGAEVGVAAGVYSETMCKLNPGVKLFCIDSWKSYSGYWEKVPKEAIDLLFAQANNRLAKYNVAFVKSYSEDASRKFKDNSLDFVYIDGNHTYPYVLQDIKLWSKKVRKGGIIAGHDFIKRAGNPKHTVIAAVVDYTSKNKINPWFILGRREKGIPGEIRDSARSWFWVKA